MTPAVEITRHAVDFYNALCRASFDDEHANLNLFPEGGHDHAVRLFGVYLQRQGCGDPALVTASREADNQQHCWITLRGLIVDLTAGRFREKASGIIVAQRSPWHEQWYREDVAVLDSPRVEQWLSDQSFVDSYMVVLAELGEGGGSDT